jgi:hypothetical protein
VYEPNKPSFLVKMFKFMNTWLWKLCLESNFLAYVYVESTNQYMNTSPTPLHSLTTPPNLFKSQALNPRPLCKL